MDLNIRDKVMIVTGGASGIGEAITRLLAEEGAVPVVVDRDEKRGQSILQELEEKKQQAHLIVQKLDSEGSCRNAVRDAMESCGRIDGLFNNAGVNDGAGLEKGTARQFVQSVGKNLHHYFFMAQACLPELKRNKGVIINISSKTAVTGQGGTSGYAASKGAQLALTREWAVELLEYGIRVNAIIPAEVITPQYKSWLEKNFDNPAATRRDIENRVPFGKRFTTPREIAEMAVFLVSGRAGHITGQHIYVDGGYVHLDRALGG
jgi:L-fucose dehydrogenase